MWRFSNSAEIFLPSSGRYVNADSQVSQAEAAILEELYAWCRKHLDETESRWKDVESALTENHLEIGKWDPSECFEAGGGSAGSSYRSAPLCVLCYQPAMPLALGADADAAAASTLFKGGLWHVQCANFWIRHGVNSTLMKERGLNDPSDPSSGQHF